MYPKILNKTVAMSLTLAMVFELTACGTIFYPERKGTKSGSIDPVVAVADAIGLLFFFIPGVVAFAVDFSNGTIYTSGGRHFGLTSDELKAATPGGKLDKKVLSEIVSKKMGKAINLDAPDVQLKKFTSEESLMAYMNATGLTLASL